VVRLFFSYSHRDEELRNELEIHLASLRRQGVIETWHDRRIVAGEDVHDEISEQLENADIVLLLVSPYFIASDYCYDLEMVRAMERHRSGETHVIPVILHPCDWQGLPFGELLATPTDGKPVSKFPNQHDAFLEVTKAIRRAAEKQGATSGRGVRGDAEDPSVRPSSNPIAASPRPSEGHDTRSSNLRIKKHFTDHEKDQFLDDAFEYIANYFEGSLAELEKRNPEIKTRFKRVDSNQFTAAIYAGGSLASGCRIWMGERQAFGGIAYSAGESGFGNGIHESLSVDDDGYSLFLKPLGMFMRDPAEQMLTYEGGAESYWNKLIEPLQR
jgi:hypothetical protein